MNGAAMGSSPRVDATELTPFRIHVGEHELDDLKRRLEQARWPIDADAFAERGVDPRRLRSLTERWLSGFDWRAVEADLNRYPQVITEIDGQSVHALVVAGSRDRNAGALVLLHGWPSTVAEFVKVIDELAHPTCPGAPSFDVIVPSLPGYGFSGPTREAGWNAQRMGSAIVELVTRLGYSQAIFHGGDAGLSVATAAASRHPDRVAALHLHIGGVRYAAEHRHMPPLNERQRIALERFELYDRDKSAYAKLQATRPQTLAFALTDSPLGQLAWIAEKFYEWTDPEYPVSEDDILTAASVYWFTRTAGSSARFYSEVGFGDWTPKVDRIEVPTAIAAYPREIVPAVREWVDASYRIVRWTDLPDGGHFAALERPDLVLGTLRRLADEVGSGMEARGGAA